MADLTFVVPMLNASARVGGLMSAIDAALADELGSTEIVLVDDGSTDDTWAQISDLARRDRRVVAVRLAQNVGQTGALGAGFSLAEGSVVVMMDDDLEIEPSEYRGLVAAVRNGAEFASGRRVGPRPAIRSVSSRLYNARLRTWGMPYRDAGCGFNALSSDLAKTMSEQGWAIRLHRFKPRIAQLTTRIVEVDVPVRLQRVSHYGLVQLAASWIDIEQEFGPGDGWWFRRISQGIPGVVAVVGGGAALTRRSPSGAVLGLAGAVAFSFARATWREVDRVREYTSRCSAWEIAELVGRG